MSAGSASVGSKIPFAQLLMSKDIIFAFGVVLIVIMMVVPLPALLLNIFLTLNIALALTILLVSIYNKDALEFSAFPSLLLVQCWAGFIGVKR